MHHSLFPTQKTITDRAYLPPDQQKGINYLTQGLSFYVIPSKQNTNTTTLSTKPTVASIPAIPIHIQQFLDTCDKIIALWMKGLSPTDCLKFQQHRNLRIPLPTNLLKLRHTLRTLQKARSFLRLCMRDFFQFAEQEGYLFQKVSTITPKCFVIPEKFIRYLLHKTDQESPSRPTTAICTTGRM